MKRYMYNIIRHVRNTAGNTGTPFAVLGFNGPSAAKTFTTPFLIIFFPGHRVRVPTEYRVAVR